MADRAQLIEDRLRTRLDAVHVEVIDSSPLHGGHPGAQRGGHFRVLVVSQRFEGLDRVAAQRMVYQALGELMTTDIHALELRTLTPGAWQAMAPR